MANVRLVDVKKAFGAVEVLKGVDLEIADGEFVVFVGPSGCGKSTLLRTIAGLEEATTGQVSIGDRVVNDLSPSDRGIAMVFQSYALYPHMTAYENMAFGLKLAKTDRAEIDRRVRAAAEALSITDYLSNLDAALRVRMRYEFARLHAELKTTMIYVTHDQVEAMTLADRIVVLNGGRIEQVGAPMDLYQRPANLFVAGFIGSPRMNLLTGEVVAASAAGATVRTTAGETIRVAVDAASAKAGDRITLGVRPEHLSLSAEGDVLTAEVLFVEPLGATTMAHLKHPASQDTLTVQLAGGAPARVGESLTLHVPADQAHLFDAEGRAFSRL